MLKETTGKIEKCHKVAHRNKKNKRHRKINIFLAPLRIHFR